MNKKILIPGSSGFIGSHLTELFIEKGYDVIAYDRYNIENSYGWLNDSKYKTLSTSLSFISTTNEILLGKDLRNHI